ncbi:hypothetical protein FA15DRAFT_259258 [Coprinopsis marcescibilis]|uniref:Uncharacterized protein n=1 Tax=Coprinopsis marcescibilis TaxID=230819 RepID=A0A5C3L3S8_COPMA|nr:hypothetical protein FA15DRAFT_259258 [Coprinopsis marcescibilis]
MPAHRKNGHDPRQFVEQHTRTAVLQVRERTSPPPDCSHATWGEEATGPPLRDPRELPRTTRPSTNHHSPPRTRIASPVKHKKPNSPRAKSSSAQCLPTKTAGVCSQEY